MHILTEEAKHSIITKGANLVGVADAESLSEVSKSKDPFSVLENAKSVIVFAVLLPEVIVEDAPWIKRLGR